LSRPVPGMCGPRQRSVNGPLQLQRIVGEAAVRGVAVHDFAHEGVIGLRHLAHLHLDPLEVLGCERARHLEVVVEAVLDGRPEADAGTREEIAHRGGEDVSGRVAQHLQRLGISIGEDGEGDVPLDRPVEIPHGAVHLGGHGRPGEPGADALGHRPDGRAGRDVPHAAVRQRDPHRVAHSADTPGGAAGGLDGANQK
jgi:hypothetical protein